MNRNMRKALSSVAAIALAMGFLGACGLAGNSTGDDSAAPGGESSDTAPGTSDDAKTPSSGKLVYWSMWSQGEPVEAALSEVFNEFTAETGIEVDVQWQGRDVLSKVVPRMNAGNPPDLVDAAGTDIEAALGPVDGLIDLTNVYDAQIYGEDVTLRSVVPPAMLDQVSGNVGYPYLLPYSVTGVTLWYNDLVTDIWADAPPATWSKFIADMNDLKAQGRTPLSIEGSTVDNDAFWLWLAVTQAGGAGAFLAGAQDPTGAALTSDAWVAATDALDEMIKGDFVPDGWDGTKYPVQQSGWADQTIKSDVMAMGTWLPQETNASLEKEGKSPAELINYRSMAFPQISDSDKGGATVPAGLTGFAITSKAKNVSEAEQFLAFFMSKQQQEKFVDATKLMSTRSDVPAPTELQDFADRFASAEEIPTTWDGVTVQEPKWYSDVLLPALQPWWSGQTDSAGFRSAMVDATIDYHAQK